MGQPSSHSQLLYAQTWEDARVLRQALRLKKGETALSIAAAGDNSFALLLDDPAEVVAIDRNHVQLQLVRLKMAAISCLSRAEALEFLGERHGSRTVPRLHQGRVVFVEGFPAGVHQRVVGPGFGDEQRHRMTERVAAREEEFESVVERGRVGCTVADEGPELLEVVSENVR